MRPAITFKNSDVARQWKKLHMSGRDVCGIYGLVVFLQKTRFRESNQIPFSEFNLPFPIMRVDSRRFRQKST